MTRNTKRSLLAAPLALAAVFIAVNPARLYAIFGAGDVVFDPTSYATLGKIWDSDVATGTKLAETYTQTVKIATNALQTYNLAVTMAQRVQNKSVWMAAGFAAGNEVTTSHYGESINMSAIMNGDVLHAGTAWNQGTYNAGNAGYLGSSTPQSSYRMAQYSTGQLMDQTSQRCLQILGNYQNMQNQNKPGQTALFGDTYDQSDAKNSMIAGLNVLAGGHLHLISQNQANGNLAACQSEQQTLIAKAKRDELAQNQIWWNDIATERATTPALLDPKGAAIYGAYLVP